MVDASFLHLVVVAQSLGFSLAAEGRTLGDLSGCGNVAVCNKDNADLTSGLEDVMTAIDEARGKGDKEALLEAYRALEGQLRHFDFDRLGKILHGIGLVFPDEQRVHVGADFDVPWQVVTRILDVARPHFPEATLAIVMDSEPTTSKKIEKRKSSLRIADLGKKRRRVLSVRSKKNLDKVINFNTDAVDECYERRRAETHDLEGRVTVRWLVDFKGRVRGPKIVKSTLGDDDVEKCITQTISKWRFDEAAEPSLVQREFDFSASDEK